MIIAGKRLVHFGKIADISSRRYPVENLLPRSNPPAPYEKLIHSIIRQPSIAFFTAKNSCTHLATHSC
jgi:hypothetical protein